MASSEPSSRLRFSFLDVGVPAIAELDHSRASRTVSGILEALPIEADSFHGIYSGSEVACLINPEVWLPTENATSRVLPGEIVNVFGRFTDSWPEFVEICRQLRTSGARPILIEPT